MPSMETENSYGNPSEIIREVHQVEIGLIA